MIGLRRAIFAASLLGSLVGSLAAFAQAPPAIPALPDSERRTAYSPSGTTCQCAVNFAIFGTGSDVDSWIQVWVNGVRYLSTDATYGWSLSSATGSLATIPRPITDAVLTFNSAQTGTVQIVGADRPRQLSQFAENRGVAARDLNQRFTEDRAITRELWDKTSDLSGRGLFFAPGNTTGAMPQPSACVNQYLAFDSTGHNPTCVPGTAGGVSVSQVTNSDGSLTISPTTGAVVAGIQSTWLGTVNTPTKNLSVDITKAPYNCAANGTDQYACIQAVIVAVEAMSPKPCIFVPTGNFRVSGGAPTLNNQYDCIEFAVGSIFNSYGADVTLLDSANSDQIIILNGSLVGKGSPTDAGTFGATQCTLNITGSSGTVITGIGSVNGGLHAGCNTSGEVFLGGMTFTDAFGSSNFYNQGGVVFNGVATTSFDQASPVPGGCSRNPAIGGSTGAWQATHSQTCGDVVTLTYLTYSLQVIDQTAGSCTTGGSSPTPKNYAINFTDGSCSWQLENPAKFYLFENASGSGYSTMMNADLSSNGATASIGNTGGTPYFQCFACDLGAGVYLNAGSNMILIGGSCITVSCFTLGGSWAGQLSVYGVASGSTGVTDIPNMKKLTNAISGNVSLNNTSNYFDGPSVAQGTLGTWWATGQVTVSDSAGSAAIRCKLWDGTTVIASGEGNFVTGLEATSVTLSGFLAAPAANIKISCRDISSTSGSIKANVDGVSNTASSLTVLRIN